MEDQGLPFPADLALEELVEFPGKVLNVLTLSTVDFDLVDMADGNGKGDFLVDQHNTGDVTNCSRFPNC